MGRRPRRAPREPFRSRGLSPPPRAPARGRTFGGDRAPEAGLPADAARGEAPIMDLHAATCTMMRRPWIAGAGCYQIVLSPWTARILRSLVTNAAPRERAVATMKRSA